MSIRGFWNTSDYPAPKRASSGAEETRAEPSASERPISVFELTSKLKRTLETQFSNVFVEGEISNCRPAPSGHVYFALKDRLATISCVLWATDAARLEKPLRDGDKVEVRGRISLYEPRGQYQIVVDSVRPAGIGRLFLEFQKLKERLEKEGLFAPERKRPIPKIPRAVGIVTSAAGAALRDCLQILSRRAPHVRVFIYPARVQGEGASVEIAYAIRRMNELRLVDILIVGRGGGSIEDLWAFNEEIVARAIATSKVPVISAVGHETDFTIADFVADLRAPTPSAAAELVSQNSAELIRNLRHLETRLASALRTKAQPLSQARHLRAQLIAAMRTRIQPLAQAGHLRSRLEAAMLPRVRLMKSQLETLRNASAFQRPVFRINELRQQNDDLFQRMERAALSRLETLKRRAERINAQLRALDPRQILSRGFSITFDRSTGEILRSARDSYAGQPLRIALADGQVDAAAGAPGKGALTGRKKSGKAIQSEWFGEVVLPAQKDDAGEA